VGWGKGGRVGSLGGGGRPAGGQKRKAQRRRRGPAVGVRGQAAKDDGRRACDPAETRERGTRTARHWYVMRCGALDRACSVPAPERERERERERASSSNGMEQILRRHQRSHGLALPLPGRLFLFGHHPEKDMAVGLPCRVRISATSISSHGRPPVGREGTIALHKNIRFRHPVG
jgi:hypothetical protein